MRSRSIFLAALAAGVLAAFVAAAGTGAAWTDEERQQVPEAADGADAPEDGVRLLERRGVVVLHVVLGSQDHQRQLHAPVRNPQQQPALVPQVRLLRAVQRDH